jgi:hypothetical protein
VRVPRWRTWIVTFGIILKVSISECAPPGENELRAAESRSPSENSPKPTPFHDLHSVWGRRRTDRFALFLRRSGATGSRVSRLHSSGSKCTRGTPSSDSKQRPARGCARICPSSGRRLAETRPAMRLPEGGHGGTMTS